MSLLLPTRHSVPIVTSPPPPLADRFGPKLLVAAFALVALKLWLVAAQRIFAVGFANYDDALFVRLADFIRHGQWLGPYDHFTLAKGPMYPVFIATVNALGLPLFPAQHAAYAIACGLLVLALRPLVAHRGLRCALFAVLLFNPVTFDSIIHTRVLRQNILHALVLGVLAGFIGLYARRSTAPRRLLPWTLLAGLALPAFWLTREEGLWLLPTVVLLWGAGLVGVWQAGPPERRTRLFLLALPAMLWAGGLGAVAGLNYRHYGVFTTCEFTHPAFQAAYGALLRVTPVHWHPYIAVPRETRERLYPLSPAFASLQPEIEGKTGEAWAGVTAFLTGRPDAEREIGSIWFAWAMRRAAYDVGQTRTAPAALAFYERVAREVNAACDRGLIPAGPTRTGFVPPLPWHQLAKLPASWRQALWTTLTFGNMAAAPQGPSYGQPGELALFSRMTRGRLLPPADGSSPRPAQTRWEKRRTDLLGHLLQGYRLLTPWATGVAVLAWLVAGVLSLRRRRFPGYFFWLSTALAGAVLAQSGVVAVLDITMFPAMEGGYFTGAYPPLLLFLFTSGLAVASVRPTKAATG